MYLSQCRVHQHHTAELMIWPSSAWLHLPIHSAGDWNKQVDLEMNKSIFVLCCSYINLKMHTQPLSNPDQTPLSGSALVAKAGKFLKLSLVLHHQMCQMLRTWLTRQLTLAKLKIFTLSAAWGTRHGGWKSGFFKPLSLFGDGHYKWAASWQNQQCAPSEDSDQPGHPPSLIRVFAVRMKKAWVLSYQLSIQRRLIRLGGCPGWSESSLGTKPFSRFCHGLRRFKWIKI